MKRTAPEIEHGFCRDALSPPHRAFDRYNHWKDTNEGDSLFDWPDPLWKRLWPIRTAFRNAHDPREPQTQD